MIVRILFTKGRSRFSGLICSVLQEPVSHVAIQLGCVVVHSNLKGVHFESAASFYKKSNIVYSMTLDSLDRHLVWQGILKREGKPYDIGAFLFIGISFLLRRLGFPLPKSNLWSCSGMDICTEFVQIALGNVVDSMITPYKLYLKLKEQYS